MTQVEGHIGAFVSPTQPARPDEVGSPPVVLRIPPVVRRNTLLFAATQALVGIGTQLTPTLSAIMIVSLSGSTALAGLGTSIVGSSRFLVAYPIGWVNDTYGRRAGLFLGLLLGLIGSVTIGVSALNNSFSGFLFGIVIFGLGVGATQQLRTAAADMYPPSRRAEGVGFVLTGSLIGALGGPLLVTVAQNAGPALGIDPMALAWLLVPVVVIPCLGLVFLVRPDPREIALNLPHYYPGYVSPPRVAGSVATIHVRQLLNHPSLRLAFVCSFAVHGNMTMMMALTSLALAHHGHELPAISLSVALHVIGMFGFSLPLGRLADRVGRLPVLAAGVAIAYVGSLLVPATDTYWTITAGTFLVGLGWSCVNVAASALIADATEPSIRGRAIGLNDTFSSLSSIALPVLAGPVVAVAGLPSLIVASTLLMVAPVYLLLRSRTPALSAD